MGNSETVQNLTAVHNVLTEISVKGEDAIRMGKALMAIRKIVADLASSEEAPSETGGGINNEIG